LTNKIFTIIIIVYYATKEARRKHAQNIETINMKTLKVLRLKY